MLRKTLFPLFTLCIASAIATCFDPSPAFPVPEWTNGGEDLSSVFDSIETQLRDLIADQKYDAASFSVEVTSSHESLWSQYHTARKRNESRPGAERVDGDSLYRIASITKVFTTLGLLYQYEAGNLDLQSPISKYIPELAVNGGEIPWHDITLRTLASQLSGLPRDFAQSDLMIGPPDPISIGLPPASRERMPDCDEDSNFDSACDGTDLIDWLRKAQPLFAPNQQSTYSNLNFELIGLALERASDKDFKTYMRDAILEPLNMTLSTLNTPSDDTHAVLPLGDNYWGIEDGVQNPTGGIYSSTNDMSKFLRYILTHYNAIAPGINWLMPASWGTGSQNFYGMPFEILRTGRILTESTRPVTFATKGGGLPGYTTLISIVPEYGLGVTVLVGCSGCGKLLSAIQEIITVELIRGAEEAIWKAIDKTHRGVYTATDDKLNSSLELAVSPSTGLMVKTFVSNDTDVLGGFVSKYLVDNSRPWHLQLVPTLLFKNESAQQGEIWRMIPVYEREEGLDRGVWDELCSTDVDILRYAGLPLNEVVFWHDDGIVELPAWKVRMSRDMREEDTLVVQN
ncbi:hypothetical protein LTR37_008077 [Vermiconidia calcicola]|uniref:Uncharacterized protein n=1 Tax=Vermiconidia calcicola TaxID=1690605 RepID=A0ACC3NC91_9PEZI|nr:hypothetical protein LTR37_008077 [Vermiconidia calcicola]